MILNIDDFNSNCLEGFYYKPRYHIKETEFFKELVGIHNTKYSSRNSDTNWLFLVDKSEVFAELGWEVDLSLPNNRDQSAGFPEFITEAQALLFLVITLRLHNERVLDK